MPNHSLLFPHVIDPRPLPAPASAARPRLTVFVLACAWQTLPLFPACLPSFFLPFHVALPPTVVLFLPHRLLVVQTNTVPPWPHFFAAPLTQRLLALAPHHIYTTRLFNPVDDSSSSTIQCNPFIVSMHQECFKFRSPSRYEGKHNAGSLSDKHICAAPHIMTDQCSHSTGLQSI